MKASFDIEDYIEYDEIKNIIKEETRWAIKEKIDKYLKSISIDKLIGYAAKDTVLHIFGEQDPEVFNKLADKTKECIDDLSSWNVFRDSDEFGKSNGQQILDEYVEEARPKIQQKVDDIIENKLNADFLIEEVTDRFYIKLRNQLIGDNNGN